MPKNADKILTALFLLYMLGMFGWIFFKSTEQNRLDEINKGMNDDHHESQEWLSSDKPDSAWEKEVCEGVESEFQNAFECIAYPLLWDTWDRINEMCRSDEFCTSDAGDETLSTVGCPIAIQKLEKYNLTHDERLMFTFLTKTHADTDLRIKYQDLEGVRFCDAAVINGWYEHYLKSKVD